VTSSKLTSEKVLSSGSRKRVNTPPQMVDSSPSSSEEESTRDGCDLPVASYLIRRKRGVCRKRTPRLDHSTNFARTSSVTKTTCVARPISFAWAVFGFGAISDKIAVPSGGETATQRSPFCSLVSNAR
jgi:hypothetical protein